MNEIEVKILEINKEQIINTLIEHGAKKTFEGEIHAEFYINKDKKKIRLRKKGNKFEMCYKEKMSNKNTMSNIEYELGFDNYENFVKILEGIGFTKYGKSYKYRISYQLHNIIFDIDKYEGIPTLVEIESTNIQLLKKGVILLGYNMSDTCTLTERPLKEYYGIPVK